MTIKELLNLDVAKLEAMSDSELREHYQPYLVPHVLDPEPEEGNVGEKVKKPKKPKQPSSATTTKLEIVNILKQHNLPIPPSLAR